ncbi:transducin family protein / WD-40 repeat family protein [Artemisia annua]|uniref:Transducin family protein / WD-40 repeat family protein n=1 Tax=Artemisia annua TaxID=35608 RepID=A0A2U1KIA0_ARTAN|nr:transducin family protein / WD-40 repeat family protein [Artemisia annua]
MMTVNGFNESLFSHRLETPIVAVEYSQFACSFSWFQIQCSDRDKLLHILALLKLDIVQKKGLIFTNTIVTSFRLKLFLEQDYIDDTEDFINIQLFFLELLSFHLPLLSVFLEFGGTDDKPTKSLKIQAIGVFKGHDDTVEDVQFCPSSAQELCSVGDDSCLILWDARTGSSPVVKVIFTSTITWGFIKFVFAYSF